MGVHAHLRRTSAVLSCIALTACVNGPGGAPSPTSSPAAAAELARQKAMQQAQRESQQASCFPQAVLRDGVRRLPLALVAMPATPMAVPSVASTGASTAAAATPSTTRPVPPLLNPAQAKQLRATRTLVPVYCRNVEPASVQPTRSAADKLREAAARFDAAGVVVDTAEFATTLRVRGNARYAHIESREVGRTETYVDRYGNPSSQPGVTLQGGRRIVTPVIAYRVDPIELAESVEVPARYIEGWALVRVSEAQARAHQATCAQIAGEADKALVEGDREAVQAHFEAIRTCDFYSLPIRARTSERPAVVPFQPEEP